MNVYVVYDRKRERNVAAFATMAEAAAFCDQFDCRDGFRFDEFVVGEVPPGYAPKPNPPSPTLACGITPQAIKAFKVAIKQRREQADVPKT